MLAKLLVTSSITKRLLSAGDKTCFQPREGRKTDGRPSERHPKRGFKHLPTNWMKETWPGKTYKTSRRARASLTRPGMTIVAVVLLNETRFGREVPSVVACTYAELPLRLQVLCSDLAMKTERLLLFFCRLLVIRCWVMPLNP